MEEPIEPKSREELESLLPKLIHEFHEQATESRKLSRQALKKDLTRAAVYSLQGMIQSFAGLNSVLLYLALTLPETRMSPERESIQKLRQEIYGDFTQLMFEVRQTQRKRGSKDYDPSVA